MKKTRELIIAALFIALGLVLPMVFHTFNMGGPAFLPMHIPVLLGGLILSPLYALAVGLVTPVLSSLLTGMPPLVPMLPIMFFELGAYGLVSSLMKKNFKMSDILSLVIAMIVGRIVAGLTVFVLVNLFTFKLPGPVAFIEGAIVTGLPGIAIQIVAIPLLMVALRKAKVVE